MHEPQFYIRTKERTDEKYGKRLESRSIPELLDLGLVIIDKPIGPSSHQVSNFVGRILNIKKTGHLGTLDPNVSGVLPVLLGRATPAASFLIHKDKEYVGIINFHKEITKRKVENLFKKFTGKITQIPPIKSAVARRKRTREIYSLKLLEMTGRNVLFKVSCEAGTYVRKLAHDIGIQSKVGANLTELRRIRVGKFIENNTLDLYDLSDAFWLWNEKKNEKELRKNIIPLENTIDLKKVWVSDNTVEAVCSGAQVMAPGIVKVQSDINIGDDVAIFTLKDEIVAFGEAIMRSENLVTEKKGKAIKIKRVIIKRGTYPKAWKKKKE